MEEKFLYYLGAGASAQALPTVKPIKNHLGETINDGFIVTLRAYADKLSRISYSSDEQKNFLFEVASNMRWLADESNEFSTIDTYAKYLFLRDAEGLKKLKRTLSIFFSLYQLWERKIDKRYLSWVTSIMATSMFPVNVKILTWNYDFQIQLAAEVFKVEELSVFQGGTRHSPPLISYWPAVGWSGYPNVTPKDITLLHLNGLAGAFFNSETQKYDNVLLHQKEMGKDSNLYHLRDYGDNNIFNFAWENGPAQNWLINLAQKMVDNTTILVVIGYSFPFFNRDIDKKVFEKLKESGRFKKIYFQDPILDGSFLRGQFDLGQNIEIIHRKEVAAFYIPFEL